MSLSDYSSDSDGEAAILHGEVQEAKTAAFRDRRGAEDGTSVGTAVAALALGGVAAGFLVWRMVMRKKHPKKKPQLQETGNTGARKELRRKRPDPHTGESPRTISTMLRSESTSSVGPRRKQPRRDASDSATESGGELSGASPRVARPKALRKTSSSHGRRRPPQHRPAQPSLPPFQGLGSGSEAETAREEDAAPTAGSASAAAPARLGTQEPEKPTQGDAAKSEGLPKAAMPAQAQGPSVNTMELREAAPHAEAAPRGASKPSGAGPGPDLPDVVEPTSAAADSQPSLSTFTDVDVLDRAVEEVSRAATQPSTGKEQGGAGDGAGKDATEARSGAGEEGKAGEAGGNASRGSEGCGEGDRGASADSAAAPAAGAGEPKQAVEAEQQPSLDLSSAETEVVARAVEEAAGEPGQVVPAGAEGKPAPAASSPKEAEEPAVTGAGRDQAPGASPKDAEQAGGPAASTEREEPDQAGTDQAEAAPGTSAAALHESEGLSGGKGEADAASSAVASLASDVAAEATPVQQAGVAEATEAAGGTERDAQGREAEEGRSQGAKEDEPSQVSSTAEASPDEGKSLPEEPSKTPAGGGKHDGKGSVGHTADKQSGAQSAEDAAAVDAMESAAAGFDAASQGSVAKQPGPEAAGGLAEEPGETPVRESKLDEDSVGHPTEKETSAQPAEDAAAVDAVESAAAGFDAAKQGSVAKEPGPEAAGGLAEEPGKTPARESKHDEDSVGHVADKESSAQPAEDAAAVDAVESAAAGFDAAKQGIVAREPGPKSAGGQPQEPDETPAREREHFEKDSVDRSADKESSVQPAAEDAAAVDAVESAAAGFDAAKQGSVAGEPGPVTAGDLPEEPDETPGKEGKHTEEVSVGRSAETEKSAQPAEDAAAVDAKKSAAAEFDTAAKQDSVAGEPAPPAQPEEDQQPSALEASSHGDDGAAASEHGTVSRDLQAAGGGDEHPADASSAQGSQANGAHEEAAGSASSVPAAYDPLSLDEADVAGASKEVPDALAKPPASAATEDEEDGGALEPRCTDERDVELNLAVALRMIAERGNYAAAERTLQKQLGVIRDAQAGGAASAGSQGDKPAAAGVRPQYACRLAGTLADVIARGEREAAALGRPSGQDRRAEIVGLLRYAFEARLMRSMIAARESGDGSLRLREAWRLAAALVEAEDLSSAEQLFKEELDYSKATYGPVDLRTYQSQVMLADIWQKQGKAAAACKLLKDAAGELQDTADKLKDSQDKEFRSNGGGQGQDLTPEAAARQTAAKCWVHLAQIQDTEKEYPAAKASVRQGIALMEAMFGDNNPRTSTAYGTLAAVLKHEGTEDGLREALGLYERLQAMTEDIHGPKHQNNALAVRSIADIHAMLGQHGEAASYNEKAAQVAGAVYGRDHPVLESYWRAVADSKQQMGDTEGARDANRRALHVRARSGAPVGMGRRGGGGGRRAGGRSTGRSSRH